MLYFVYISKPKRAHKICINQEYFFMTVIARAGFNVIFYAREIMDKCNNITYM